MGEQLRVEVSARLLDCLLRGLPTWKRRTLEKRLRDGCVSVNGTTVRRNDIVQPGDVVLVADAGQAEAPPPPFPILLVDEQLLAIDKPAGLVSVSSDRERRRTALSLAREWLARPREEARLWPVHRLDRETSGVLLFARTPDAREALQAGWASVRKRYFAIVEGRPDPPAGTIEEPLYEDARLDVRVGYGPDARPARTRYQLERAAGARSLLAVELDTGRRHQIRAHLAWLGLPVVGDPRYGRRAARMGLHAHQLVLAHPGDGRELLLSAPIPRAFRKLLEPG